MRAAQYTARGQIDLVTVADSEPAPGGLLLRANTAAICGSDLHFLHDSPEDSYPWKPGQSGHECVAVVAESADSGVARGARVLALPPEFNAFAELFPAQPEHVIALPEDLESERGVLAQQLGTVVYCCRKFKSVLDRRVAVVGQGPAGLLFTMLLRAMGARQIIGLDLVAHRLDLARAMGASRAINVAREDPAEAVRACTGGKMADIVVEAVGRAETINLCPALVRDGGEIALFGVPKKEILPIALEAFMRKNVRIVTSVFAQGEPGLRSFRLAIDLIASGRIDVAPLVSHRLPFAAIREGFHLAETKHDGAVKVLLEF